MTPSEYIEASSRTAPDLGPDNNQVHASLGMLSELGELADTFKRELAYGKEVDPANVLEEVGDLYWYLALHLRNRGIGDRIVECFDVSNDELEFVLGKVDDHKLSAWVSPLSAVGSLQPLFIGHDDAVIKEARLIVLFTKLILSYYGFTIEQAMQANIDKLMIRYPEKFTQEYALNRDTTAELEALEKAIEARQD